MNLLVVGLNHRTASVTLRERVAFSSEELADALPALRSAVGLRELAILSTCNRTEAIAVGDTLDPDAVIQWISNYHQLPVDELVNTTYIHRGAEAVHHTMTVACGMDSMVLGESQIFGQFKDCFNLARMHHTIGPELDNLAQTTNRVAKRVRTETGIGENTVSIASTSVTLAQQLFTDIGKCNVLLIGAGETIELVATHLQNAGIHNLVIANRTLANAQALAETFGGKAIDLGAIPRQLIETDILISSTGSQLPILGKGAVERALKSRRHKPIFMVDLAVPRDIEPEVSELRDVYLYSIDDLQSIIVENLEQRQTSAAEAARIIDEAVMEFVANYRALDAVDTLRRFRQRHDALREEELTRALQRLAAGESAEDVLTNLARQLTNKIVHVPTIEIKKAGSDGRQDLLNAIEQVFQLQDSTDNTHSGPSGGPSSRHRET